MKTSRRNFLLHSATLAGLSTVGNVAWAQNAKEQAQPGPPSPAAQTPDPKPAGDDVPAFPTPQSTRKGDMLYRTLGNTGQTVSLLGLGGFHISVPHSDEEATTIVRKAIDHGVTFMDNCWDYANGRSEVRMGQALQDGYRQKVFLMTKLDGRTAKEAKRQLDESLKRLQVDMIDLMQMHEILRMEDPDRCFEPGGVVEALQAARKAGKIRFIGFTGHKDPAVHLRMLETAKKHNVQMDTVQMPLNVMDAHFRSFAHQVIPVALQAGVGILGMKPLGSGEIIHSNTATPIECLHYAMNLPTSVVITGCDSEKILDQALEAVRTFQPMTHDQVAAILDKTKQAAADGHFERFKTSAIFDGTAKNPQWLG